MGFFPMALFFQESWEGPSLPILYMFEFMGRYLKSATTSYFLKKVLTLTKLSCTF